MRRLVAKGRSDSDNCHKGCIDISACQGCVNRLQRPQAAIPWTPEPVTVGRAAEYNSILLDLPVQCRKIAAWRWVAVWSGG